MHTRQVDSRWRYVAALGLATGVSVSLLLAGWLARRDIGQTYLLWNLFLAWIPLGLAWWLRTALQRKAWSSWEGLAATAAWLAFLPNSFYMITDFMHLVELDSGQLLYGTVVFSSFISTALLVGFSSLYIVHGELHRRLSGRSAAAIVALILLACSVAIYIGRDLRWNTWDVLVDPAGVLFDLSSRLITPSQYGQVAAVVAPFFVLLGTLYTALWQGIRSAARAGNR